MLEWFRPILTSLALPPVPFIALILLAVWLGMRVKKPLRTVGAALVVCCATLLWLTSTSGMARWLEMQWITPAAALTPQAATALAQAPIGGTVPLTAIVVLGGGRLPPSAETGEPDLETQAMDRLRYGVWLARRTGFGLGYSGGVSWSGQTVYDKSEADVAQFIAQRDYGIQMQWLEGKSRYTKESAELLMPMLAKSGVKRMILVTTAYHMPRSVRSFRAEAARAAGATGMAIEVIAAPTGFTVKRDSAWVEWLPSGGGARECRQVLREWIGYAIGR